MSIWSPPPPQPVRSMLAENKFFSERGGDFVLENKNSHTKMFRPPGVPTKDQWLQTWRLCWTSLMKLDIKNTYIVTCTDGSTSINTCKAQTILHMCGWSKGIPAHNLCISTYNFERKRKRGRLWYLCCEGIAIMLFMLHPLDSPAP